MVVRFTATGHMFSRTDSGSPGDPQGDPTSTIVHCFLYKGRIAERSLFLLRWLQKLAQCTGIVAIDST